MITRISSFHFPVFVAIAMLISGLSVRAEVFSAGKLREIDREINAAVGRGTIPGAVIWLESKGEVYHKAYGLRMASPEKENMTPETLFDVASLTKVLATTPAILHLHERGLLDLDAPVSEYIPEFLEGGIRPEPKDEEVTPEHRETITVKHLITHQ
ncbi:MAG: beta-lactamase family protein, partial [Verrucomicrobiales bacterium]|nr:beta-lactamase family protein [Verrucomicrobiales bacterium]